MLSAIDHKLFNRWRAYFRVRDAEAWEIAGTIAAAAWNAALLTSGRGAEAIHELWRQPEEFVPAVMKLWPKKRAAKGNLEDVDVQALAATWNERFGPKV